MNIYEKIKEKKEGYSQKSLIIFTILSVFILTIFHFLIKFNLSYLLSLDFNKYLILIFFLFSFNFLLVLLALLYDLERFIILIILMTFIIYFNLLPLLNENYLLSFFLLGCFIIGLILLYYLLNRIYKLNIFIDWLSIFRSSWNLLVFIYFFLIFFLLIFLPSLEKLNFQNIYDSLGKFSNLKWRNQFSLESKISDILSKEINNLDINNKEKGLIQKIKNEIMIKNLKNIEIKFNINLTPESTVREVLAKYLAQQIDLIKQNNSSLYFVKALILFIIFMMVQPIFYLLGFLVASVSLILLKALIYLKIFRINYRQVSKEEIEI